MATATDPSAAATACLVVDCGLRDYIGVTHSYVYVCVVAVYVCP